MKISYLITIIFLLHSYAEAKALKAGEIKKATIIEGFKVSNSLKGFPVLIYLGWEGGIHKKSKKKSSCTLVANANPDFAKQRTYLYLERIECNDKDKNISAYITDTNFDFGIKSGFINSSTGKYLKVDGGTKIFVVITQVNSEKIQISDSGH